MIFAGIDPGLDGAICKRIREDSGIIITEFYRTPTMLKTKGRGKRMYDIQMMTRILEGVARESLGGSTYVALEKQQAMRDQGVSSTFSIGRGFGLWEGMLAGLKIPYVVVHPKTWHKKICGGIEGGPKERALSAAQAMEPGLDLRISARGRIPHQGKVDALCLAEYARRTWNGDIQEAGLK